MKHRLLFILLVVYATSVYSQAQGPPPPCGIPIASKCDLNNDDVEHFDLVTLFPFSFCIAPILNQADYYPTTYHESEVDAKGGFNQISNPESYMGSTLNPHVIHFRSEKIVPDGSYDVLYGFGYLYVLPIPTVSKPKPLIVCNSHNDGFGNFDLVSKKAEILSGQQDYGISFFGTFEDAQNLSNAIPLVDDYNNTIAYKQTIYASVFVYGDNSCIEIVELDLIVQGKCEDLAVYLTSVSAPPRPGFEYSNRLSFKNEGSKDIAFGTIEFKYDSDLDYVNAVDSSPGYTITEASDGFTLNFINLEPGESDFVNIYFVCPVSTNLGTQIINAATYITNSEDTNPINDISFIQETVIGSYDPNDINESHGPKIQFEDFTDDDYLYYTIRFQNVGTADAINITIENELDDKLDESTFQKLNTSHISSMNRVGENLTWTFKNIHLPSEDMDEPASHGYVYYKIKPKPGYTVGDIIPNIAGIHFDFNAPVITNTFETEFTAVLYKNDNLFSEFIMYPNPAKDFVSIKLGSNFGNKLPIKIYDIQGKLMLSDHIENKAGTLNVSNLSKGMYFLKLENGNHAVTQKLIIE